MLSEKDQPYTLNSQLYIHKKEIFLVTNHMFSYANTYSMISPVKKGYITLSKIFWKIESGYLTFWKSDKNEVGEVWEIIKILGRCLDAHNFLKWETLWNMLQKWLELGFPAEYA